MPFKKPFSPDSDTIISACKKPLHPEAEEGIRLFNEGKYFIAHEAFEIAWRAEHEPDRRLYQGILQAGIVFMHARNQYTKGVLSMYERCRVWLRPWPDHCRTIDIGRLRSDLKRLVGQVITLGPDKLMELDPNLFTQIKRVEP
jgi:predicted metal-dependent hydrolase